MPFERCSVDRESLSTRRGPGRTTAAKLRTIDRQFSCEKVPKLRLFVKIQLTREACGAAPQDGGAAGPASAYLVLGKAGRF